MSRIQATFERLRGQGRKALIPFITAGFPEPGQTLPLMQALVTGGADIIELGVPFSDPMADGPTIQRASEAALSYGVSLRIVLGMVREFRKSNGETPVVLMGYANPIEAYGSESFARDAKEAGVDGVLVVDYPPEECGDFTRQLKAEGLDPIFLLAPTSTEARCAEVAVAGSGYIYYVSLKGVTGSGSLDLDAVARRIPEIRERVGMPVGVGFGIRDGASAARIAEVADAVVIGSRIIEEIEHSPRDEAARRVTAFLQGIRNAMDKKGATP
ncbi:tryptophan synthase subunit alpha [Denitratisoma oestradiolicum]|uniref:Tryptophan synthase alpha chain n=1 Tax=Denitratisoma oestradiolicum TaxID=311182 RepID=A0A6S6XPK3_9PROT|nr:tryptophan synthase subunit alpha [Denitratisoma oestradiolicum]TWO81212.1 tryptophan synthase subunit alpha [Denitratisoma oestradiolicum]CAB1367911.1 Tryptophan synthase alpha chain [Denitratisoma oestradiolicum]